MILNKALKLFQKSKPKVGAPDVEKHINYLKKMKFFVHYNLSRKLKSKIQVAFKFIAGHSLHQRQCNLHNLWQNKTGNPSFRTQKKLFLQKCFTFNLCHFENNLKSKNGRKYFHKNILKSFFMLLLTLLSYLIANVNIWKNF